MAYNGKTDRDIWKGLAAGLAGGLVASLVMNRFQALWAKLASDEERPHGAQSRQKGSPDLGIGAALSARGLDDSDDDATERLANAVAVVALDQKLTETEKHVGGLAFHYAMGITSGGIYGTVAEFMPLARIGFGLGFGTAVWAIADEGIVPATGLSRAPSQYPAEIHAYAFTSHLVFGLTTELMRRLVRRAL